MNSGSRSTRMTSMSGLHMRMYFAAVAPAKPAPITTTRAIGVAAMAVVEAREIAAPAGIQFRNCLRETDMSRLSSVQFLGSEEFGDQLDLLVRITLGMLVHDRRLPRARLVFLHRVDDVGLLQPGQAGNPAVAAAVGAVASSTGRGQVASAVAVGRRRGQENRCQDQSQNESMHMHFPYLFLDAF